MGCCFLLSVFGFITPGIRKQAKTTSQRYLDLKFYIREEKTWGVYNNCVSLFLIVMRVIRYWCLCWGFSVLMETTTYFTPDDSNMIYLLQSRSDDAWHGRGAADLHPEKHSGPVSLYSHTDSIDVTRNFPNRAQAGA